MPNLLQRFAALLAVLPPYGVGGAFGAPYEGYRREVGAILPFVR